MLLSFEQRKIYCLWTNFDSYLSCLSISFFSIPILIQNITETKTATEAQNVLEGTKNILTGLASNEIITEEEADLADEIVNTGANIAKSVAQSTLFQTTNTSSAEKKIVRQVRGNSGGNCFSLLYFLAADNLCP